MTFDAAARALHDFYILAGTGAAALVGLLFVGLSLHLRVVISVAEVRSLARFTLANFGAVLFVAMFLVIEENRIAAGLQLIGSAVVTILVVTPSLVDVIRERRGLAASRAERIRILLRFASSGAGYLAVGGAGFLLLAGQIDLFMVVIEVSLVLLLAVALRNTWDLLVTVGRITAEDEKP